jgi:hypothetical protein
MWATVQHDESPSLTIYLPVRAWTIRLCGRLLSCWYALTIDVSSTDVMENPNGFLFGR